MEVASTESPWRKTPRSIKKGYDIAMVHPKEKHQPWPGRSGRDRRMSSRAKRPVACGLAPSKDVATHLSRSSTSGLRSDAPQPEGGSHR